MEPRRYRLRSTVWLYPGDTPWHFVTVDRKTSEKIKESQKGKPRRGWGSVRVTAKIGKTSWQTSIFPEKKSGTYILPIKAEVRKREGIASKDTIVLAIDVMD